MLGVEVAGPVSVITPAQHLAEAEIIIEHFPRERDAKDQSEGEGNNLSRFQVVSCALQAGVG